jgi:hypothetical protein
MNSKKNKRLHQSAIFRFSFAPVAVTISMHLSTNQGYSLSELECQPFSVRFCIQSASYIYISKSEHQNLRILID